MSGDDRPNLAPVFAPMIETSLSMLDRLKGPVKSEHWEQFVRLYTPLLVVWAQRAGVPSGEVGDLVQEVFVQLLQKLPGFAYDPERGRFRSWLRTVTLNKWRELVRRRTVGTSRLRELPDVPAAEAEAFWDGEYREQLVGRALAVLRPDFRPATWEAFRRVVIEERSAAAVAAELNLTVGAVHAARFRVLSRLRQELTGLLD